MDARSAPLSIQEEAFRLGIIPYIPALKRENNSKIATLNE
jgi:hypothetical protein